MDWWRSRAVFRSFFFLCPPRTKFDCKTTNRFWENSPSVKCLRCVWSASAWSHLYIKLVNVDSHITNAKMDPSNSVCQKLTNRHQKKHKNPLFSWPLSLATCPISFKSTHTHTLSLSRRRNCGWWFPYRPAVTVSGGDRARAHTDAHNEAHTLFMYVQP